MSFVSIMYKFSFNKIDTF